MLSISAPLKGAGPGNYYLNLSQEDYYAHRLELPGQWFGQGAGKLGLGDIVKPEDFLHLLSGCSPDGRRPLVQNARDAARQSGWDLTFSAPKSVSVFWALAPAPIRQQVEQVHQRAVEVALAKLEETCGVTRRGRGGAIQEPAALAFAMFQHGSSRAQDPQLHTHAVLINLGLRQDGTTGTLQSIHFFGQKMAAGALYQDELIAGLQQCLGLNVERERVGFHIVGVPHPLCHQFSKRRQAIEAALKERGKDNAVAAKVAALDTRQKKESVAREDLFAQWQKVGEAYGWAAAQVLELTHPQRQREPVDIPMEVPVQARERKSERELRTPEDRSTSTWGPALDHLRKGLPDTRSPLVNLPARIEWERLDDRTPWIRPKRQFVLTQWQHPFPGALWGPARKLRLPVLVVALPRLSIGARPEYSPRWWKVYWKKDLGLAELRLQQRFLFPHAPDWSPFRRLSVPTFRFATQKVQPPVKPPPRTHDHGHTH